MPTATSVAKIGVFSTFWGLYPLEGLLPYSLGVWCTNTQKKKWICWGIQRTRTYARCVFKNSGRNSDCFDPIWSTCACSCRSHVGASTGAGVLTAYRTFNRTGLILNKVGTDRFRAFSYFFKTETDWFCSRFSKNEKTSTDRPSSQWSLAAEVLLYPCSAMLSDLLSTPFSWEVKDSDLKKCTGLP